MWFMKGVLYHSEHFLIFFFFPPLQLNSRSCIICCHHSQGESSGCDSKCWEEGMKLHLGVGAACAGCSACTPWDGEAALGALG